MVRFLGPKLRKVRRLNTNLVGFCASKISKRKNLNKFNIKPSLFGILLKERQKLRFNYGLTEQQLRGYVKLACKKQGPSGFNLMQLIEMRLDASIFRIGFASSIIQARNWITHGFIFINLYLVKTPSFLLKKNDIIHINPLNFNILKIIRLNLKFRQKLIIQQNLKNYDICLINFKAKINKLVHIREILLKIIDTFIIEHYTNRF